MNFCKSIWDNFFPQDYFASEQLEIDWLMNCTETLVYERQATGCLHNCLLYILTNNDEYNLSQAPWNANNFKA